MTTISNLFIDQDADFTTTVTINDSTGSALDLTSYTTIVMLRKSYQSSTATTVYFAFVSPRTTGQITISLTDVQTVFLNLDVTFMT